MNDEYKSIYNQATQVEFAYRDNIDAPQNAAAVQLAQNIHELVEAVESEKNPHNLEDAIKRLVQELEELKHQGDEVMDFRHIDDLRVRLEHMREELHKFSNY